MRVKKKVEKVDSSEPLFYAAFVLKCTENQYLKLLKYIEERNHAQIIYQCKSLTYLYITKENPQTLKMISDGASAATTARRRLLEELE